MPDVENYENLVLGSGAAGKLMTWTLAGQGQRTALVERGPLGGACPNVACLPSKNIIHSARVATLAKRGPEFGLKFSSLSIDMKGVQQRKRLMVEGLQELHVRQTVASGAHLFRAKRDSSLRVPSKWTFVAAARRQSPATGCSLTWAHVPQCGLVSITVTREPNRRNAWDSSRPT